MKVHRNENILSYWREGEWFFQPQDVEDAKATIPLRFKNLKIYIFFPEPLNDSFIKLCFKHCILDKNKNKIQAYAGSFGNIKFKALSPVSVVTLLPLL